MSRSQKKADRLSNRETRVKDEDSSCELGVLLQKGIRNHFCFVAHYLKCIYYKHSN